MARLCVRAFGVSLDGFAAGPEQSLEHPLGVRGPELMAPHKNADDLNYFVLETGGLNFDSNSRQQLM